MVGGQLVVVPVAAYLVQSQIEGFRLTLGCVYANDGHHYEAEFKRILKTLVATDYEVVPSANDEWVHDSKAAHACLEFLMLLRRHDAGVALPRLQRVWIHILYLETVQWFRGQMVILFDVQESSVSQTGLDHILGKRGLQASS